MRILIVGGGMAGWTLAGHLRRRGITPVLVEKVSEYRRVGFFIGLYPFSANTLRETGCYDRYREEALAVERYVMLDGHGHRLQEISIADLFGAVHSAMGGVHRATLLDLLRDAAAGTDLRMGTTVTALDQQGATVGVTLSNGEELEVDLVVGTDGIHSATRALVGEDTAVRDWGYTAFTWWAPPHPEIGPTLVEQWGPARFFGVYPLRGEVNMVAALPTPDGLDPHNQEAMRATVLDAFPAPMGHMAHGLRVLADGAEVGAWPMADQRVREWVHGRVALCGDAAAAFLPTAGVGASNAIKAAQVLADELGRADAASIPDALSLWCQRVREKVEANHEDSRKLAKLIFVRSRGVAEVRDLVLRHYPVERVAKDILSSSVVPF